MPRFVVLYHDTPPDYHRPAHWDLMLEADGVLRTWALTELPTTDKPIQAESLADHRLDYLTYEGAVPGERGTVQRLAAGEYTVIDESRDRLQLQLDGQLLAGTVELTRPVGDGTKWRFLLRADVV